MRQNRDPRVVRVMRAVLGDLSRRYTLSELAAIVRMSSSGFRNLFTKELGCSFGKWQKRQRFEMAKSLLCGGDLSVKEIAAAIGYQDSSHFVREFEMAYGQSPTRYRRTHYDGTTIQD